MQACIGHMKENGGWCDLNMASIAGSSALADRFAYSMSKGAVIAMTYSVAKDYIQHKIRCNCISPARVHTPFVDGYLQRNYRVRKRKCSQSSPLHTHSEDGGTHTKLPPWRYFYARGSRVHHWSGLSDRRRVFQSRG